MKYKCSVCNKKYNSYQKLGGHKTVHTRLSAKIVENECCHCKSLTSNKKFCSLRCKTDYFKEKSTQSRLEKKVVVRQNNSGTVSSSILDITYKELDDYRLLHPNCEICGQSCSVKKNLSIDHNHATGKFRGLLCFKCNIALGNIENHLEKTVTYLSRL